MDTLQTSMQEYRTQLNKGMIQKAYKGLMDYMQELKTHFAKTQPAFSVSGSLYFGMAPSLDQWVSAATRFSVW